MPRAGIRVAMVTGDSARTAAAIAREIGLVREKGHVIVGSDLDGLDDEELRRRLSEREVVFARIDPEQNFAWHGCCARRRDRGHDRDGVNDARPQGADIGLAMGMGLGRRSPRRRPT